MQFTVHTVCILYAKISLPPILIMSMLLVYIYQCVYITAHYSIRMSYSLKLVVCLGSMQAFSAQCEWSYVPVTFIIHCS